VETGFPKRIMLNKEIMRNKEIMFGQKS